MSEKRFVYGRVFPINSDNSLPCITDRQDEKDYVRMSDLVDLLNEQQATIEHLTKSRDKWRELSNSFSFYCKCYEKAIERAFEEKPYPTEDDINRIYAELEKELEDE